VVKNLSLVQISPVGKISFGGKMSKKLEVFLFKLMGTEEIYEVEAEDSAEAFRRCMREKAWPVEKIIYQGKKEDR
jgi:hypothetical protein